MIDLRNIYKSFNKNTINENKIFEDFNLNIADGEFISLIGSNGSGKTTLLNLICGQTIPDKGKIFIGNEDYTLVKEHLRYKIMGRVFQDPSFGTSPSMTILENLSMADNKGKSWDLHRGVNLGKIDIYREKLKEIGLGLEDKLNDKVKSLSGGQRQALSLLMASMTDIKILILDEHTANLDPKTRDKVMELTDRIIREKKLTSIMVTHNLNYSLKYGNRLMMLHEGKILLDKKDKEKENLVLDDILDKFNKISIEVGNAI